MSWKAWTDEGYGIPLWNDHNLQAIRNFLLNRMSKNDDRRPEIEKAADESDFFDVLDNPLAYTIGLIISDETGYECFHGFDSCGDTDQEAYIGFGVNMPWRLTRKDKKLTKEKATEILNKYAKELDIDEWPTYFTAEYCG